MHASARKRVVCANMRAPSCEAGCACAHVCVHLRARQSACAHACVHLHARQDVHLVCACVHVHLVCACVHVHCVSRVRVCTLQAAHLPLPARRRLCGGAIAGALGRCMLVGWRRVAPHGTVPWVGVPAALLPSSLFAAGRSPNRLILSFACLLACQKDVSCSSWLLMPCADACLGVQGMSSSGSGCLPASPC